MRRTKRQSLIFMPDKLSAYERIGHSTIFSELDCAQSKETWNEHDCKNILNDSFKSEDGANDFCQHLCNDQGNCNN